MNREHPVEHLVRVVGYRAHHAADTGAAGYDGRAAEILDRVRQRGPGRSEASERPARHRLADPPSGGGRSPYQHAGQHHAHVLADERPDGRHAGG